MNDSRSDQSADIEVYEAPGITIYFNAARSIGEFGHLAELPEVFDRSRDPWIDATAADPEKIAAVIRKDPSGALQYDLTDGPDEEPDVPTRIDPQVDGALYIRGDIRIALKEGVARETRAALCRCGRSGNKPFCDKTCEASGWKSEWHPPADQ